MKPVHVSTGFIFCAFSEIGASGCVYASGGGGGEGGGRGSDKWLTYNFYVTELIQEKVFYLEISEKIKDRSF